MVDRLGGPKGGGEEDEDRRLTVGGIYVDGADNFGLARLAEISPELAKDKIDADERMHRREMSSKMFGMAMAATVLVVVLGVVAFAVHSLGFWLSMLAVLLLAVGGALLHVLINGEWPEKSFIGGAITAILGGLGGRRRTDDNDADEPD